MGKCKENRNFMNELRDIICEIDSLKPEPYVCNLRCFPLRKSCPAMRCYGRTCDAYCMPRMPCEPSCHLPSCCIPDCLKNDVCNMNCLPYYCCLPKSILNSPKTGCFTLLPPEQAPFKPAYPTPYNPKPTGRASFCYTDRSMTCWNV